VFGRPNLCVVHTRLPLSYVSTQEEIWKVEEGMPSGLYTAKGRRDMFRNYKMCKEDEGQ